MHAERKLTVNSVDVPPVLPVVLSTEQLEHLSEVSVQLHPRRRAALLAAVKSELAARCNLDGTVNNRELAVAIDRVMRDVLRGWMSR